MGSFPNTDFPEWYGPIVAGPPTINGGIIETLAMTSNTFTTDTNPAAGWVMFRQFTVDSETYLSSVVWSSGAVHGGGSATCEVAIYNENRTRLCTTGTVTVTTAAALQTANFTPSVTIKPGCYYLAYQNRLWAAAGAYISPFKGSPAYTAIKHRAMGTFEQNVGNTTLPATATFAVVSTNATVGVPYIAILGRN